MTRRVRFTPWLAAGVFVSALGVARAAEVPFVALPPVPNGPSLRSGFALGDLDRDGDVDVALGATNLGVLWLENADGAGTSWNRHTVSTALNYPFGVAVADVDRDGDLDLAVASTFDGWISWFENASGNGATWTLRPVFTNAPDARGITAADLDRDGDVDLAYATRGFQATATGWLENLGAGGNWTAHSLATLPRPYLINSADVDGDGDVDLVTCGGFWQRNVFGDGSSWTTHTIPGWNPNGSRICDPADIDGDGDQDIVGLGQVSPGLAWFENTKGDGMMWVAHPLPPVYLGTAYASPGDVDGDGDVDVVAHQVSYYGPRMNWLENAGHGAAWMVHPLPSSSPITFPIAADMDLDGDVDIAATGSTQALFGWYRNESIHESACFVPQHLISTAATGAQSLVAADVDGDGDLDVVSTARGSDTVAWHENAGGAAAWTTRTITTTFDQATTATAGDVDRDGDVDVAALQGAFFPGGALAWFDNTAGNGSSWTPHTVGTGFISPNHVEMVDLSGDGDLDLLASGYESPTRWFENAADNGTSWTPATLLPPSGQAGLATGDIDGDGDPDLASTEAFLGDGLSWTENTAGNGSAWTVHTIATENGATFAIDAVDIDTDGDLDVLQPGVFQRASVGTVWYENVGGNGSAWTGHPIPGSEDGTILAAADLDRDGDPDVIQPGSKNGIRWFENAAGDGAAWLERTLSDAASTPQSLSVGDLDGDGDPDVLSTAYDANTLAWHENQGGQASIGVVDQAPPIANNSEVVSMLRATVTHLGRPGDGPIELASLGLRFEVLPGFPLSTGQANALVDSLRIYLDADGNGVFGPAADVLVTSIGTLALTVQGVQIVPFTDGGANVQVTPGAARAYFVVVELTSNASGQMPHQLMVTLLQTGPSTSVLEDRTFDIPLRLACPADVASGIKLVVPVELIGFSVE